MATHKKTRRGSRAAKVEAARPRFQGWRTTDKEEIERRRARGSEEGIRIETLEPGSEFFGTFLAHSLRGEAYCVEIRSLSERLNSCDCPDYQVNGLGTCKHIEATLLHLQKGKKRRFQAAAEEDSGKFEVFLDRRANQMRIIWPRGSHGRSAARTLLSPFFASDDSLLADPLTAVPALGREISNAQARVRNQIRLSGHLEPWLERRRRHMERENERKAFEADVAAGKRSLDVVGKPLYPYQREGMLHLAFTARTLLADEMGLGKTVQAVAACELLRRLRGIQRVMVISPASLKAEWEEQIAKFTGLPSRIIQGPRAARLRQYREPTFFYLTNYEQIRVDARDINEVLMPDVIILDEAQRIKNWQTKTADAVKRLTSPYAFVLTGTPLENRIDEIYSIVQFLDPHIFGPLFRFNRDFYKLDDRGRPVGYKNLDEMHRRLRHVMLRRRKEEVEDQLPGRTVNTFFVDMHPEQVVRYDEYSTKVARLLAQAKRRPLTKEELEKLQQWLACMRMLCDTPYILDQDCRVSPKLHELEDILVDLMDAQDHKVIIFSEWERMLQLVRELAEKMELGYAWHTGSVPQARRRPEIRRFKDDPDCRLFLSTDSGSVGLNLQAANVVINLDQPWNPAKLEQRIARAWRKHQRRTVQVINLVAEHSIEHRILHLLDQKRTLAEGVVDGAEHIKEMALPSGRAAFLERIENLLGEPLPGTVSPAPKPPAAEPAERLREDILARWSERLHLLEFHTETGKPTVLAVFDQVDDTVRSSVAGLVDQQFPGRSPQVETLDRDSYETIQRLIDAGVLSINPSGAKALHRSPAVQKRHDAARERRLKEARGRLQAAEPKQRMARVLAEGGFPVEALAPLAEAVETTLRALAYFVGEGRDGQVPIELVETGLTEQSLLPREASSLLARLRQGAGKADESKARLLVDDWGAILEQAGAALEKAALV